METLFIAGSENYNGGEINTIKNLSVNIIDEKHQYRLNIRFPNMVCREFLIGFSQRFKIYVTAPIDEIDKIWDYLSDKSDFEVSKVEVLGLDRTTDEGEWEEVIIKEYTEYNILQNVVCNIESKSRSVIQITLSNK